MENLEKKVKKDGLDALDTLISIGAGTALIASAYMLEKKYLNQEYSNLIGVSSIPFITCALIGMVNVVYDAYYKRKEKK